MANLSATPRTAPLRAPHRGALGPTILFVANTPWYLFNFQLQVAERVRRAGGNVTMVCPDGPYRDRLEAAGFDWLELNMSRPISPLADLRALPRWIGLYRHTKPELVHHFTTKCVVYGTLAARLARVPAIVNTVSGLGFVFGSETLAARLIRPPLRLALRCVLGAQRVRVLFQNEDDRSAFQEPGVVPPARGRLVPGSGVDLERFRPDPGRTGQPVRFLMACRLLWDKGVAEFVEAARHLRARGSDAEFVIAGAPDAGNPRSVPEAQLTAWARQGVVEWLGHRDDMDRLLRKVDAVVLPTAYREGIPRILLEAAATGLPIVTADAPGCRDAVSDGDNGILVPARDVPSLVAAMDRLTGDELLRHRMGAAGRVRAERRFDVAQVADAVIETYQAALQIDRRQAEPWLKRPFDVLVSGIGLLVLSPVWLAAAIAIKLQDGGPVFFRPRRWGRDGRAFDVLKFRTMIPDANRLGIVPAQENDPRVTRVGRLLRATAMHELPQLLSIFRGHMSIVGPRPLAIGEVLPDGTRYESVLGFDYRLSVRPGLTSLAAIYLSKDASPRHKFRYDAVYIRNHSSWLDLRMILLSFWITLRGRWESHDRGRRRAIISART